MVYSRSQIEWPFHVKCDAGTAGSLSSGTEKVTVTISHKIMRDGREQMWDCVFLLSQRELDGGLRTSVLLCNPDWDEPLEVATVDSGPLSGPVFVSQSGTKNGKR